MSMKINWINHQRATCTDTDANVHISIYKPSKGGKSERVRFRFSEGVHASFFENTDRILVGTSGNRIYFKPANNSDGYKISPPYRSAHLRVFWVLFQPLADFIHEHPTICEANLQYDDKQNLFYIEAA